MIKILKWEILKEIATLKWMFMVLLSLLFILSIIPIKNNIEPNSIYEIFLFFSNIILSMVILFFTTMYTSLSLIFELRQPYSILEKSIPQPFMKILTIRLIINFFIFLISSIIGSIGMNVMNRFSSGHMSYMHFSLEQPYLYILLCFTVFCPLIIQFFYLASSNIPILKIYPIIGTIIFATLFMKILLIIADSLPNIALISFQVLITLIAFGGSCLLYEKYYSPK